MFILVGLLFIVIAVPLARRRVKPNTVYGFRTPKTLSSERVWYDANAYSGRRLISAGLVTAIGGLLLQLVPGMNGPVRALAGLFVMLVSLAWALAKSFRYLETL